MTIDVKRAPLAVNVEQGGRVRLVWNHRDLVVWPDEARAIGQMLLLAANEADRLSAKETSA